jgi:hypothetical protein
MNQQKPYSLINLEAARNHFHQACQSHTPVRLWHAVADIPVLLAELSRLRSLLALVRAMHANLLAAARATIAATRDGEADSMYYLRDELDAQDQLPPEHLHAAELLTHPYLETIDDPAGEQDRQ